jgi:uncharacterized protein
VTKGASPFVVPITDLRRTPGTQHVVEISAPLPALALSSARVQEETDVLAVLTLELLVDGRLTATGTVEAAWEGTCRRCLETVTGTAVSSVREVFERHPSPDAETYLLDSDRVDLESMVRDAVLLALPLAPLCRPDCPGPDPVHPVVPEGDETVAEPDPDPRWAKLRDIRFE